MMPAEDRVVWTVGHGTRPLREFLDLLRKYGIATLVDVRRHPGSRRHPQYSQQTLHDALLARSVAYVWLPALGGRRAPRLDSPNVAWRNLSFRGYADHMDTGEFEAGLQDLLDRAAESAAAIMCAERVWWSCHRALIADALRVRGWEVRHILDERSVSLHPYTKAAKVVEGRLRYFD